ncbi:hypothetical protein MMB232_00376 [Brevundimonas subvibrioides]
MRHDRRQSVDMLVIALISLGLSSAQDAAVAYGARLYEPPVVRPFEPPSNFGRVTEEGDGGGDPRRRPITRPVAVEAYSGSYEYPPSTADEAYTRGVTQAERTMDARMGPLDGIWRVQDASGATVLSLALMDAGAAKPIEGAWRKDGGIASLGVIERSERSEGSVSLGWAGGGLTVRHEGPGWTGELLQNGRAVPVTLSR